MPDLIPEQHRFLQDLATLIQKAQSAGYVVTGGELWRTPEQQAIYVSQGLSKALHSNHERRLAVDLNFFKRTNGDDKPLVQVVAPDMGQFWESLNPLNRWGGHFTTIHDPSHFERNSP